MPKDSAIVSLHACDVFAIPERLQEGIGEAEIQEVLHRLLAEKMIDAEDMRLVEHPPQATIQRLRRRKSRPSGFSTTTRAPRAQPEAPSRATTSPNRLGGIAR